MGNNAAASARILDFLRLNPGTSVAEIAEGTGLDRVNVASRLVEAANREAPLVSQGAPRGCRISGLVVATWRLKP